MWKATLHLMMSHPPEEVLKQIGEKGFVKEDCVIEDINHTSTIHIWDHLLSKKLLLPKS